MRRLGHNVQYIHRTNRTGYKAGALAHAMPEVTGEFIVNLRARLRAHARHGPQVD